MLRTLIRVEAIAAALGVVTTIAALVGWGVGEAVGVFVGSALAIANFHLLRWLMSKLILGDGSEGSRALLAALGGLKLVALIAVVGFVISTLEINPWGFFLGTLSLVVAIPAAVLTSSDARPSGDGPVRQEM